MMHACECLESCGVAPYRLILSCFPAPLLRNHQRAFFQPHTSPVPPHLPPRGATQIETWYFAPYPDEFARQEKLYICEFCCKYMKKRKTMVRHAARCAVRHPPGHEIYRSGNVSFFEVDGTKNKIYCQVGGGGGGGGEWCDW